MRPGRVHRKVRKKNLRTAGLSFFTIGWCGHFTKGVIKEHKPKDAGETETGFFKEPYVSRRIDNLLEKRTLCGLLAGTMAAV